MTSFYLKQVKVGCGLLQEALPSKDGALGGERGKGEWMRTDHWLPTFTFRSEYERIMHYTSTKVKM